MSLKGCSLVATLVVVLTVLSSSPTLLFAFQPSISVIPKTNNYLPTTSSRRPVVVERNAFCRHHPLDSSSLFMVATPSKEEELVYLEDDDDDDKVQKSYADFQESLEDLVQSTSNDPNAVTRAQKVFDEMLEAYMITDDDALCPDTNIYNLFLKVHVYHNHDDDNNNDLMLEAQRIVLEQMARHEETGAAPPDVDTYAILMEGWIQRNDLERVLNLFDQLPSEDWKQTTVIYNKLIKAYGKITANVPKVQELLTEMLESTSTMMVPNQKTWVHVLRTYASRQYWQQQQQLEKNHNLNQILDDMHAIFGRMTRGFRMDGHEDWTPSTLAYNALLQAYNQAATIGNIKENQIDPVEMAKEAESVLYTLMQSDTADASLCRPNAESFQHVFQAYSHAVRRNNNNTTKKQKKNNNNTISAGIALKMERLLQMEHALHITPTPQTYVAALIAMSYDTKDSQKAIKMKRVMTQQDIPNVFLGTANESRWTIQVYKSLITACAYTNDYENQMTPQDKLTTFQIALEALQELQKIEKAADSRVYGLFLRACGNLLSATLTKRDQVVETIFQKCCTAGYTDDYVLDALERSASDELLLKLLGGFLEDGVSIPEEWSRNVR